jgi:hypothetical protein
MDSGTLANIASVIGAFGVAMLFLEFNVNCIWKAKVNACGCR